MGGDRDSATTKVTNKVMVKCFSLKGIVAFHNISLPNPTLLSMEVLTHAYPLLKHLFSKMTVPIYPLAGRLKHFLPASRLLTKYQSVVSFIEWFKIPLLQERKQMFPPKPQRWNKDQKKLINLEVKEMLEKGAISKVSHQEGFFQSNISSREKRWVQQVSNQSKKPQLICALPAFQNGGFALPKIFITEWRLYLQNRFKRCIFQCAAKQGFPEISEISMGRKLVRLPLPLFWTRPSTKSFYQVI